MKDDLGGLFGLVLFVAIMWLGWPISLWLMIAIICAAVFKVLAQEDKEPVARSFSTAFWRTAMPALSNTAVCIAVGMGIVVLAQIVFSVTGMFSSATVLRLEGSVASAQHQFAQLLSPLSVLSILAALLLFTIVWPQFSLVSEFAKVKKWGGRTLLVLTTLTAFTFFSSMAVSMLEPRWVAARKTEAREAMAAVTNERRELVTLAWLEETFKTFPPDKKRALGTFLSHLAETNDPDVIGQAAREFVRTAPILKRDDPNSFDVITPWVQEKGPAPPLADIVSASREAEKLSAELPQARTAAEEALKTALGSLVPASVDPLLRPFIKALSDALVASLSKLSLPEVHGYETAVAFVKQKMRIVDGGPSRTIAQFWRWRFPQPPREENGNLANGDGPGSGNLNPGSSGVTMPGPSLPAGINPGLRTDFPHYTAMPPTIVVVPPFVAPVTPAHVFVP